MTCCALRALQDFEIYLLSFHRFFSNLVYDPQNCAMHLMKSRINLLNCLLVLVVVSTTEFVIGEEPEILKISSEESITSDYSHRRAVDFLDRTSMAWTNKYRCFTCHTNFAHLLAVSELKQRPLYFYSIVGRSNL